MTTARSSLRKFVRETLMQAGPASSVCTLKIAAD
jgi:hypothetical protein